MRPDEERLVVLPPRAPHDAWERALRIDGQLELYRPVDRLDPGCERVLDEEAVPAQVTRTGGGLERERLH